MTCLICDAKVSISGRGSCNIFHANSITCHSHDLISQKLGKILDIELNSGVVHSHVICRKCLKLIDDIDGLEVKLNDLRSDVVTKYYQTLMAHSSENQKVGEEYEVEQQQDVSSVSENANEEVESEHEKKKKRIQKPSSKKAKTKSKPLTADAPSSYAVEGSFQLKQEEDVIEAEWLPPPCTVAAADNKAVITSEELKVLELEKVEPETGQSSTEQEQKAGEDCPEDTDKIMTQAEDNDVSNLETVEKLVGRYKCRVCPKRFMMARYVTDHMKRSHDVKLYICDVCGEEFGKKREHTLHTNVHLTVENKPFECEVCNKRFQFPRQLKDHQRIHFGKLHVCDQCGKKFSTQNQLVEHYNQHTGHRPYECEYCNKSFASRYCWKVHLKTHGVRERNHTCGSCGKSFLTSYHLIDHIRTHTGQKDFMCESCGKAFGLARNLELHMVVHTGHKPWVCRICGKAFARKGEIEDHERIHTGEKPFQCELCGATFNQRSNLHSHKRATHLEDKRYKCDECGKAFKRRRLLDYHNMSVHTGERPYKCSWCNAGFVYPEHYKKHLRIHTGEKPYVCEICGKAFNNRDNRNAHRFIHSNKKPYECKVCGQGFMRKPMLLSHMQTQGHMVDGETNIVLNQPSLPTQENQELEEVQKEIPADTVSSSQAQTNTIQIYVSESGSKKVGTVVSSGQPFTQEEKSAVLSISESVQNHMSESAVEERIIVDERPHFGTLQALDMRDGMLVRMRDSLTLPGNRDTAAVPRTEHIPNAHLLGALPCFFSGNVSPQHVNKNVNVRDENLNRMTAVHVYPVRIPVPEVSINRVSLPEVNMNRVLPDSVSINRVWGDYPSQS